MRLRYFLYCIRSITFYIREYFRDQYHRNLCRRDNVHPEIPIFQSALPLLTFPFQYSAALLWRMNPFSIDIPPSSASLPRRTFARIRSLCSNKSFDRDRRRSAHRSSFVSTATDGHRLYLWQLSIESRHCTPDRFCELGLRLDTKSEISQFVENIKYFIFSTYIHIL